MTHRLGWLAACALAIAIAGCKKQDAKQAAAAEVAMAGSAGSAEGEQRAPGAESAAAPVDPWGTPPAAANKQLGATCGSRLAKIEPNADTEGGRLMKMAQKIELEKLEKPTEPAIPVAAFGNIEARGFSVTYNRSQNPAHEQFRIALQENKVFEQVVEGLNRTIRMPRTVDIQLVDCGTINAFYDPSSSRIIVCYELIDYFLAVFKNTTKSETELGNAVIGATMFSFFHEAGHGLIHQLELPAVGREEDSVDQLAALILIAGGDQGVSMALSGAYWFQLQAKHSRHQTPFWDEHAFDAQRFYNILCLIYGSNPTKYAEFVTSGNLPQDRARRCPSEYAKINKAWERLLQPHLTNGAAVNVDYTPSVPTNEAPNRTASSDPWGTPAPQPAPHPTTAPTAPPSIPRAPAATITCEDVAHKATELIVQQAVEGTRTMPPEQAREVLERLTPELAAVAENIIAECAKAQWSQASRACVMKATTLEQATKCN